MSLLAPLGAHGAPNRSENHTLQKKVPKRAPGSKWYLPFGGPWVPYLAKIPRRGAAEAEKGGFLRGTRKNVRKRVPIRTPRRVKTVLSCTRELRFHFCTGPRKRLPKASHFGGVWAPKSPLYSPGVLPEVIPEPFEATLFRTIFQSFSVTRSGSDPAECADPGSLFRDTLDGADWSGRAI